MLTPNQRQDLACAYEPHRDGATGWEPSVSPLGWQGLDDKLTPPTTCPGYTTTLPVVVEVIRARGHWKQGQLREFAGGAPSERLVQLVEVFDTEALRYERYATTDAKDGGGRVPKAGGP